MADGRAEVLLTSPCERFVFGDRFCSVTQPASNSTILRNLANLGSKPYINKFSDKLLLILCKLCLLGE